MDNREAKPKIIVMMSTYNGEQYIQEQMESIFVQEDVDLSILVRDDGSTDKTGELLESWRQMNKLEYYVGNNLGSAKSFLDLLFRADDAEYYAFSDQDDIWDQDKLKIAIEAIRKLDNTKPCLYHGLAGRVNQKLEPLPNNSYTPLHTFGSALLTAGTGCTMVFNKKLMDIIREYRPEYLSMHDAWVYRVCFALEGQVIYDSISHMKYRQHDNNVTGGEMDLSQKAQRVLVINSNVREKVAKELIKGYSHKMSRENVKTAKLVANYRNSFLSKMKLLFSRKVVVKKLKTNLMNKLLVVFNKI